MAARFEFKVWPVFFSCLSLLYAETVRSSAAGQVEIKKKLLEMGTRTSDRGRERARKRARNVY